MKSIITLTSESTLDALKFQETPLREFVTDTERREQDILRLQMKSGNEIKVTLDHPLIDEQGRVRRADSLNMGENLVESDGGLDAIVAIQPIRYFGKVINVDVRSADPKHNIVVAQGYLNGSYAYQNEGVAWLNRQLLRTSLVPKEFLK